MKKRSEVAPQASGYGVQELNQTQLAWLAGFTDGDGCIMATIVPKPDYAIIKYQLKLTLSFTQKARRKFYLILLRKLIGKGCLRDKKDGQFELALVGPEAISLIKRMKPFLFMKQKQASLAIEIFEQLPTAKKNPVQFFNLCVLADRLSNYNDTKKRTITSETVRGNFLVLGLITE